MAKPTGLSDEVRTIFEERKGQSLGHQQVFELMDVTGVDKTKERNGVRDVLTWLVGCGYLVKTGARATAAYRYSGQGMRFHKATAEELRERLMLWDSVSRRPVFGSWRGNNPAITHFAAEPAGPEVV